MSLPVPQAERRVYVNFKSIVCPVCRLDELEALSDEFIVCNNCDCSYKLETDRKGNKIPWR